jgi:hypothetical protein
MWYGQCMDDFVHIPIRVPTAFAERIDNYWHTYRLMSRASTVRVLLTWALDTAEARTSLQGPQRGQAHEAASKQEVQQDEDKD